MMRLIQQITLLLRISAAPNTLMEYVGDLPGKLRKTTEMIARWDQEIVAVGVRHAVILNAYADAIRKAMPDRPLFLVTGATTKLCQTACAAKNAPGEQKRNPALHTAEPSKLCQLRVCE